MDSKMKKMCQEMMKNMDKPQMMKMCQKMMQNTEMMKVMPNEEIMLKMHDRMKNGNFNPQKFCKGPMNSSHKKHDY